MLKWFKKQPAITVAKQLSNLSEVGIYLKKHVAVGDILVFDENEGELQPYFNLLMSMGSEYQATTDVGETITYPSDEVWYFDTECIEDHGDYVKVMERISEMIKDEMRIEHLSDFVDIRTEEAWVCFSVNGKKYRLNLIVNDDWLDINLFRMVSELLSQHGSKKRFFYTEIDQCLLVVFIDREQYKNLNHLLNLFIPCYLGEK